MIDQTDLVKALDKHDYFGIALRNQQPCNKITSRALSFTRIDGLGGDAAAPETPRQTHNSRPQIDSIFRCNAQQQRQVAVPPHRLENPHIPFYRLSFGWRCVLRSS